jgi:hypothetical protein
MGGTNTVLKTKSKLAISNIAIIPLRPHLFTMLAKQVWEAFLVSWQVLGWQVVFNVDGDSDEASEGVWWGVGSTGHQNKTKPNHTELIIHNKCH